MLFDIWKSNKTGIYFLFDYTPKSNLMQGRGADRYDGTAINFKQYGTGSEDFKEVIKGLKEIFDAETAIGIPGADTEQNSIQRVCDEDIFFDPIKSRKKRHKSNVKLTVKTESGRLDIKKSKKKFKRALLCDDIATTGHTMNIYSKIVAGLAVNEIVPFVIAHKQTKKTYNNAICLVGNREAHDLESVSNTLNLSKRRVQQLVKEGILPKPVKRVYDLDKCIGGYIRYLKGLADGKDDLSLTTERALLAKEQRISQELKNAKERGELIPATAVKDTWARIIIATKTQFLALPDRLAQILETAADFDDRRALIDSEVKTILNGLAEGGE